MVGYGIHRKQNRLEDLQLSSQCKPEALKQRLFCDSLVMLGTITGLLVREDTSSLVQYDEPADCNGSAEIRWTNSDFLILLLLLLSKKKMDVDTKTHCCTIITTGHL